jgi:biotin carboxylase
MSKYVVIVDPRSSGIELAPEFKRQGIKCIAVTLKPLKKRAGFGTNIYHEDFEHVFEYDETIKTKLKKFSPLAIIAGAEAGIDIAERLAECLTPERSNDPTKIHIRQHKAFTQWLLEQHQVPSLKTLNAQSVQEVKNWILKNQLEQTPLIVKPPISAGSDLVFHISKGECWINAFNKVLNSDSNITGQKNSSVIVQEQAIGTEYAVGTVSADGKHHIAHLIKYKKRKVANRETVYDYVELVDANLPIFQELIEYTKDVLNTTGVLWGPTHTEIMLTSKGPRLIESSPRMCGGPVNSFARQATGSSQVEKTVSAYLYSHIKPFHFKQTVMPVFLKSPLKGEVRNAGIFNEAKFLSTFYEQFLWFQNGDHVPKTVDYLTSIGIIALSGKKLAMENDYQKIRFLESQLMIKPFL